MAQSNVIRKAEAVTDDVSDQTTAAASDARTAGATIAAQADDIAVAAREALAEMRRIVDTFATKTGEKAEVAGDAVEAAGAQTADRIGTLVDDALTTGRDGLGQIADRVSKRPVAALAIAAGIGILVGLATRSGPRA